VDLGLAAQLHDIGKIGIPDSVLLKQGRLDPDELAIMRTHAQRGYDILAVIPDDGTRASPKPCSVTTSASTAAATPGR
jgi:HD-GYP domain-containing protein (c-di-GMP phosphodiesterase class II)